MRFSKTKWLASSIACFLTLSTASVANAADTAWQRMQETQANPIMITLYAEQAGISQAESERRLRFQVLRGLIEPELRTRLSQRFAGITRSADWQSYTLFVTDSAAADAARKSLEANQVSQLFKVATATYSLDQLTQQQQAVSEQAKAVAEPGDYSIEIDIDGNHLTSSIASDVSDARAEKLQALLKRTSVDNAVRRGPRVVPVSTQACTYPHCSTPLRGGVSIAPRGYAFSGVPEGACTAGFMAVSPGPKWSEKHLVTAGHCTQPDSTPGVDWTRWKAYMRSYGDREIGYVGLSFTDGRGDATRIRVQNTTASPNWYTTAPLGRTQAWNNPVPERPVRGWVANPQIGDFFCRYGQTTSSSCGTVLRGPGCYPLGDGHGGTVTICNAWDGNAQSAGGDSGGPATGYGDIAFGILAGGDRLPDGSWLSRYTNIDGIQNNLGVWVIWE